MFGLVGDLLNGSYQEDLAQQGVNKASQLAQNTNFTPYGVNTGLGSANWNGTNLTTSLNPQYQGVRNNYLSNAGALQNQINNFNTGDASQSYYNNLHQMSAYNNQQNTNSLENDLAAKGMLGSTGGAVQMRALQDSQNQADLGQQVAGMNYGQNYLQNMYSMLNGNVNGAYTLDNATNALGTLGGQLGAYRSNANGIGAQLQMGAYNNLQDTRSGMANGFFNGGSGSSGGGGGFGNLVGMLSSFF